MDPMNSRGLRKIIGFLERGLIAVDYGEIFIISTVAGILNETTSTLRLKWSCNCCNIHQNELIFWHINQYAFLDSSIHTIASQRWSTVNCFTQFMHIDNAQYAYAELINTNIACIMLMQRNHKCCNAQCPYLQRNCSLFFSVYTACYQQMK